MDKSITHFEIRGLHGYLDFDIDIKDNTLILVGENGSGKTSVLRILYHILSGQLFNLRQYRFTSLTLCINDNSVKISSDQLKNIVNPRNIPFIERHFPSPVRKPFGQVHLVGCFETVIIGP